MHIGGNVMRGRLKIELGRDSMVVAASALPGEETEITRTSVMAELAMRGIRAGIDENAISELVNRGVQKKVYIIARGVPAKRGRDGYYEFLFDKDAKETVPRIRDDGTVDYSPNITMIEEGEKVAVYHPPVEGSFGYTVFDSVVAPPPAKEAEHISLVKVERVGNDFVAMTKGRVSFHAKTLEVKDMMIIQGNAGYATGMIDFNGDVRVFGDVKEGVVMNVRGSLEVMGEIDAATLKIGKHLVCHGGIHGKKKAQIEVGGTVTANFIEGATVRARGDVVAGHVISANIVSRSSVSIDATEESFVLGGVIEADECISVVRVGNETGAHTELKIVSTDIWSREYARIVVKGKALPETSVEINGMKMPDCRIERGELHVTEKGIERFDIGTYKYADIEEKLKEAEDAKAETAEKEKGLPMVLLVDDDPLFLKTQYTYLTGEYQVAIVNSAVDALAFIQKRVPDVILLDYMMPQMNGGELLEKIRAFPPEQGRDIPVFFLTSVTDKRVIVQCLKLYPQGYLIKPLKKEELLKILNEFFAKEQGQPAS